MDVVSESLHASVEGILADWPGEELLAANIEALRERDEQLAEIISAVVVPETASIVVAKDGSVTFRFQQEDGRFRWLGHSSVPLVAAEAHLERTDIGHSNMAVQTISHGAEVEAILEHMAPHQALLVTDDDMVRINLVFRLRDFTKWLRTGRLVILVNEKPEEAFDEFFRNHPGYNVAEQAIAWPWLSVQENKIYAQQVTLAMERAASAVFGELNARLAKWDQQEPECVELAKEFCGQKAGSLRAGNCTNVNSPKSNYASRDVLTGLRQLGAKTDWLVVDHPEKVSHYAQFDRLERLRPQLIVLIDQLRDDLSTFLPSSAVCATFVRESVGCLAGDRRIEERKSRHDFVLYPHKEQFEELVEMSLPADRLVHLRLGANAELFRPVELSDAEMERYGADVVLVADRPSSDPETYSIKLPTHQKLWESVAEEIRRTPGRYRHGIAGQYLRRAQQCGIELREEDLWNHFTELIRNYLAPAVLTDTYCESLNDGEEKGRRQSKVALQIWGVSPFRAAKGEAPPFWSESSVSCLVRGAIGNGEELNKLFNAGKIHVCLSLAGLPDQHVLNGIAAGAFFLVKSHAKDRSEDGMGRFFELDRELIMFDSPRDLARKVRYFLSHPEERRKIAESARQRLLECHTYADRMGEMLGAISSGLKG